MLYYPEAILINSVDYNTFNVCTPLPCAEEIKLDIFATLITFPNQTSFSGIRLISRTSPIRMTKKTEKTFGSLIKSFVNNNEILYVLIMPMLSNLRMLH